MLPPGKRRGRRNARTVLVPRHRAVREGRGRGRAGRPARTLRRVPLRGCAGAAAVSGRCGGLHRLRRRAAVRAEGEAAPRRWHAADVVPPVRRVPRVRQRDGHGHSRRPCGRFRARRLRRRDAPDRGDLRQDAECGVDCARRGECRYGSAAPLRDGRLVHERDDEGRVLRDRREVQGRNRRRRGHTNRAVPEVHGENGCVWPEPLPRPPRDQSLALQLLHANRRKDADRLVARGTREARPKNS